MSEASVVRLFVTSQCPDYDSPWQAEQAKSSTGSGVVVGTRRVLTGAHVVADATFIQVQKVFDAKKHTARVVAICHDADLALLEIDGPRFASKREVAEIGELAALRDRVSVVGFPVGGDEVSITEGVVSRVELQRYSHSQRHLLAVTVDAAINSGNSGGPVFKDGKVAGIAFQTLENAENIGEMVPAPLIRRFLHSVQQGLPSDIPSLSMSFQTLENEALRKSLALAPDEGGILVRSVEHGGAAATGMKTGDVLIEVDGRRVESNGTVQYEEGIRTGFEVLVGEHYIGEQLPVLVKRNGRRRKVVITLAPKLHLVPNSRYETLPRYFIYCGLVFQPLSRNYLETWPDWREKAPPELLNAYYGGYRTKARNELVLLSQALADQVTVGYDDFVHEAVVSVNGVVPLDLKHLAQVACSASKEVEFRTSSGGRLVFETKTAKRANQRILRRYRINADRCL